jgi:hypothetical protein
MVKAKGFFLWSHSGMAGIHKDTRNLIGRIERLEREVYHLSHDRERRPERPETGLDKFYRRYGKDYGGGFQKAPQIH